MDFLSDDNDDATQSTISFDLSLLAATKTTATATARSDTIPGLP
jgi:arginine repressor